MNKDLQEILPGQGLGTIKFGISRDQLKAVIGEPDEIDAYESEGVKTEDWHYDELEASFSFDEEDEWRLVVMSVNAVDYTFKGENLLGNDFEDVVAFLKKSGLEDLEIDDMSDEDTPNHKLVASESEMINFWFDDGLLQEVQWGPRFKDDETIIWP